MATSAAVFRQSRLPIEEGSAPSLRLVPATEAIPPIDAPPVFTLTPNPHFSDFVDPNRTPKAVSHPFSSNISSGKNSYVYDAHTYHTKVPPQGIELLIDYYTRPGDVVLDPFCGSGMTGVAATERGRLVLLSDLSPAAAFIACNLTTPIDARRYLAAVGAIMDSCRDLERSLYDTRCRTCGQPTTSLYTVWSYGIICKHCDQEFILWDVARDERPSVRESKILSEFDCPHCGKHLLKRQLKRTRRYPVLVGYSCCGAGLKENTSPPDDQDLELIARLELDGMPASLWYPTQPIPKGVNTSQPLAAGITSVDKMYTPRALRAMAHLWDIASRWDDDEVRPKLLFTLTSLYQRVTVFSEFRFWGGSSNTANFNVPAIMNEQNVFRTFERKARTISWYFRDAPTIERKVRVSTQSACHLPQLPDKSVDYIFTDPPFGANINYSEMNILWESWLGTYTDPREEAIVNKVQGKSVDRYRELLAQAFAEMRRVLKDDAWMTVVFHNSAASVWHALQQAIVDAGFSIDGTQTFDKQHGTFKQFVSDNAVGYDLVLHCQKSTRVSPTSHVGKRHDEGEVRAFIEQAIVSTSSEFIVRYLHVKRGEEFDYRRLYAMWLADALPKSIIGVSFEAFRRIVDDVLFGD
jgi:DNA modification methylase